MRQSPLREAIHAPTDQVRDVQLQLLMNPPTPDQHLTNVLVIWHHASRAFRSEAAAGQPRSALMLNPLGVLRSPQSLPP